MNRPELTLENEITNYFFHHVVKDGHTESIASDIKSLLREVSVLYITQGRLTELKRDAPEHELEIKEMEEFIKVKNSELLHQYRKEEILRT